MWPCLVNYTAKLPIEDDSSSEIIKICPNRAGLPTAVITRSSLYLYHYKTNAVIGSHIRSSESMTQYGENVTIKRSPDGFKLVVHTSNNYLNVYTIVNPNDINTPPLQESLTVYSQTGRLLQNGYPLTNPDSHGLKSLISNLMSRVDHEYANRDFGLRLRLVLKTQSPLLEYCFHKRDSLVTITQDPHVFHMISLKHKPSSSHETKVEVIIINELDWYIDKSEVTCLEMNDNYFIWINKMGNCWMVKNDVDLREGFRIYSHEEHGFAGSMCLSKEKSLLCLSTETGFILVYKIEGFCPTLLKVVDKVPLQKSHISCSPAGDAILLQSEDKFLVYSIFGNLNFSSIEDDCLPPMSSVQWLKSNELIASAHGGKVLWISLLQRAKDSHRAVLYSNDKIMVYKGSEVTNSSYWKLVNLPTEFTIDNLVIERCIASKEGDDLCVLGNKDLFVYNFHLNKWKNVLSTNGFGASSMLQNSGGHISACAWWTSHLVMIVQVAGNKPHSEIVIFEENRNFDTEECQIIWSFDFLDEFPNERARYLTINSDSNEITVITSELRSFTWSIKLESRNNRGKVIVTKGHVIPLADLFSIDTLFNSFYKLANGDMLILAQTTLYHVQFAQAVQGTSFSKKSATHRILSYSAEYFHVYDDYVAVFDGSKMLFHHLSNSSIVEIDFNESSTVTPYPVGITDGLHQVVCIEQTSRADARWITSTTVKDCCAVFLEPVLRSSESEAVKSVAVRFSKFRHLTQSLEYLLSSEITSTSPDEGYLRNIASLISLMETKDLIYLGLLKKIEVRYWDQVFKLIGNEPRSLIQGRLLPEAKYELAAHFLIIMLEYETEDSGDTPSIIQTITRELFKLNKLDTIFEVVRFLKMADQSLCDVAVESIESLEIVYGT